MQLQAELARFHQDLQEKTTQEEQLRQQITEKEEKTRKTLLAAKQKIAQLAGIVIGFFLSLEIFDYCYGKTFRQDA